MDAIPRATMHGLGGWGNTMTKKTYEAPVLVKREKLDRIAAASIGSRPNVT
ncbi:hypothetical protein K32_05470 [Kaistia sp. 32K]|nr:hypothetical protein K32_05470 [Kaistia sp. 32K]